MYHPLLLQPEVLRELPALLEDRRARLVEPAVLNYRSEAFAEDLVAEPAPRLPIRATAFLSIGPVFMALAGAAVTLLGLG